MFISEIRRKSYIFVQRMIGLDFPAERRESVRSSIWQAQWDFTREETFRLLYAT